MSAPSSRYTEIVPPGVNVLVVDADEVSLAITEAKLCHFGYTVFTARGVAEGEAMVEDRSTNIHLVLAEFRLPSAKKFEILEKLGRRLDVAVVILTDEEDKDVMLEALQRGAVFCLVKPIPTAIVTKLWQFAMVRKREGYANGDDLAAAWKEKDEKMRGCSKATVAGKTVARKRKIGKEKSKVSDRDDPMAKQRRPKLAWTLELHERFLQAMEVLGPERAHPKGILQLMGIPGLRKEHISSHLQKYRIYLKNMQKVAAEKSSMSLTATGIAPSYHHRPSSSSVVAVGEAGWAVSPIIGGVRPWLLQSSSKLGGIIPLMAYPSSYTAGHTTVTPYTEEAEEKPWLP